MANPIKNEAELKQFRELLSRAKRHSEFNEIRALVDNPFWGDFSKQQVAGLKGQITQAEKQQEAIVEQAALITARHSASTIASALLSNDAGAMPVQIAGSVSNDTAKTITPIKGRPIVSSDPAHSVAMNEFYSSYAAGVGSENYAGPDPGGGVERRFYGRDELFTTYGVIAPDAAKASVFAFLSNAASTGVLRPQTSTRIGRKYGVHRSDLKDLRATAAASYQADQEAQRADKKQRNEAAKTYTENKTLREKAKADAKKLREAKKKEKEELAKHLLSLIIKAGGSNAGGGNAGGGKGGSNAYPPLPPLNPPPTPSPAPAPTPQPNYNTPPVPPGPQPNNNTNNNNSQTNNNSNPSPPPPSPPPPPVYSPLDLGGSKRAIRTALSQHVVRTGRRSEVPADLMAQSKALLQSGEVRPPGSQPQDRYTVPPHYEKGGQSYVADLVMAHLSEQLDDEYTKNGKRGDIGKKDYYEEAVQRGERAGVMTDLLRRKYQKAGGFLPKTPHQEFEWYRKEAIAQFFDHHHQGGGTADYIGTAQQKQDLYAHLDGLGLATERDKPKPAAKKKAKVSSALAQHRQKNADEKAMFFENFVQGGGDPNEVGSADYKQKQSSPQSKPKGNINFGAAQTAYRILNGIEMSIVSGGKLGNAASNIAGGLLSVVMGSAAAFTNVGTAISTLVLSPLGKTGVATAKLGGDFAKTLLAGLGAAGTIGVAALRVGITIAGAIGAGLVSGVAGLGGAALGAIFGGGLGGGVIGFGMGVQFGGKILEGLTTIVGQIGGAIGQALAAVGTAIGQVGSAIGDTLKSVQDILTDLIATGTAFAHATVGYQQAGGISTRAGGQLSSLATILTGNPGGLSSMFSNMSNMSIYAGTKGAFMGTRINPENPLGNVQNAYARYKQVGREYGPMGPQQQIVFLKVMGMEALAPLFGAGGAMVNKAVDAARRTAMSPQETQSALELDIALKVVEADMTRLKTRFLSDLMPAINGGLSLVTKFFTANEGKIVKSLEGIGKFLYVKLPTYLDMGVDALAGFGKKFAEMLPMIFKIGIEIITAGIASIQKIAGDLGNNFFVKHGSPELAKDLTGFSKMHLTESLGLSNPNATKMRAEAARLRAEADDQSSSLRMGATYSGGIIPQAEMDAVEKKRKRADELDESAKQGSPLQSFADKMAPVIGKFVDRLPGKVHDFASGGGAAGEKSREAEYNRAFGQGGKSIPVDVNINAHVHDNPEALHKLQLNFSHKIGQQQLRAIQRSN